MSTTSTILHLTLPASDGSDPFSLDDQFLANWAILDDNPGVLITLAADLPTLDEAQLGRLAFLTDDVNQFYVWWNGTDWVPPNATVTNLSVAGQVGADIDMAGNRLTNLSEGSGSQAVTGTQLTGGITDAVFNSTITDGFEVNGVNFFVYAGSPVGHIASINVGDITIDTATPGLWMSTVASSDTDWTKVTTV